MEERKDFGICVVDVHLVSKHKTIIVFTTGKEVTHLLIQPLGLNDTVIKEPTLSLREAWRLCGILHKFHGQHTAASNYLCVPLSLNPDKY